MHLDFNFSLQLVIILCLVGSPKYNTYFTIMVRYCECFASGVYCDGCNCVNCHNNNENEAARREAVEATLERNPTAFRPKIASSPHGARDSRVICELKMISHQNSSVRSNIYTSLFHPCNYQLSCS